MFLPTNNSGTKQMLLGCYIATDVYTYDSVPAVSPVFKTYKLNDRHNKWGDYV